MSEMQSVDTSTILPEELPTKKAKKQKKLKRPVTVKSVLFNLLLLIVLSLVVGYIATWITLSVQGIPFDFVAVTQDILYHSYIFDAGRIADYPDATTGWLSSNHGIINMLCNFVANWFGNGYKA